ncbi:MAG: dockerin type I repeat-containing protein [Ruminococcus sp.]|nr:dockerin type I repeat-containing protein [Ruminococcus sp.]
MTKKLLSLILALTLVLTLTLSVAAAGPGGSPPSSGGGTPPGGGGSSSSVSYSGATTVTSASALSSGTYTSTSADENALLINTSGAVTVNDATVKKSGDSDGGDNCNFYGINSAVMCMGGGTTTINGGTVTATAKGANGIFSYGGNGGSNGASGDGTTVIINNVTVNTSGSKGGGIMTTGGGITYANDCTVTTSGQSSAPLRTDRGGGTVYVSGGSYTSSGLGSPAIYCTANITAENAVFISNLSEGVCIEGKNSVTLTNCDLTATNTKMNGNATFLDTIMIYQSMSGDADSGTSSYTMTGGTLTSNSGHVFHVTNTNAVITLSGVTIVNNDADGVLLSVCNDGWSGASNIATLNTEGQTLEGTILVGSDSTLTLNLSDGSVYTGTISGNITNAKGSTVSTSVGTVNVTLDSTSKWYLTGDTYITSFSGNAANVINNGYTLYVNGTALSGTSDSDSGSTETPTETPTEESTEASTQSETDGYLLGDADSDGTVSVIDATTIQKKLASLPVSADYNERAADVDGDGVVSVIDATYIQKYLASLEVPYAINKWVTG